MAEPKDKDWDFPLMKMSEFYSLLDKGTDDYGYGDLAFRLSQDWPSYSDQCCVISILSIPKKKLRSERINIPAAKALEHAFGRFGWKIGDFSFYHDTLNAALEKSSRAYYAAISTAVKEQRSVYGGLSNMFYLSADCKTADLVVPVSFADLIAAKDSPKWLDKELLLAAFAGELGKDLEKKIVNLVREGVADFIDDAERKLDI